jgi:hypothetical protein
MTQAVANGNNRAVSAGSEDERPSDGLLLGAAGLVLGVVTTLLNVNRMRTKRRL